jgi:hypothetical protein
MNTAILEVRSLTDTLADTARAMQTGRAERDAHIGFATPELLFPFEAVTVEFLLEAA